MSLKSAASPYFIYKSLALTFLSFFVVAVFPVFAQSSPLPRGLQFICDPVKANNTSHCVFQVPADIIGASFDIAVPKTGSTQIQNTKEGDTLPDSGLFFQLEATDNGSQYLFQIDYANMSAEPMAAAYTLFQFDITLSGGNFPVNIITLWQAGGELYTPESLDMNQASFKPTEDVQINLSIPAPSDTGRQNPSGGSSPTGSTSSGSSPASGSTTSGSNTSGSTSTSGSTPTSGSTSSSTPTNSEIMNDTPAPQTSEICFNDPEDLMSDAEWAVICEAKKRGIISGNPTEKGTYFFPNQSINRAEAMKIVTLGILRSLGKLSDADFTSKEQSIRSDFPTNKFINYPDIVYDGAGEPPWFALYVKIASEQNIVSGYPQDGTFRPANKINNAESYRVIVETGRIASAEIVKTLLLSSNNNQDWFVKYAETLKEFNIEFSEDYAKDTSRKEFLIIVMELMFAVGL